MIVRAAGAPGWTTRVLAVGLAGVVLVGLAAAVPPTAQAGQTAVAWRATLGSSAAGTSTIRAFSATSGSVYTQAFRLKAGARYTVTIYRGACGASGSRLFALPAVRARSSAMAVWTADLTAGQVALVQANATGDGRVSIRLASGSQVRCGTFARLPQQTVTRHRIGIRTKAGVGEFVDRLSGQAFVPRGNNYVRLAAQPADGGGTGITHSTFDRGTYDPLRWDAALRRMRKDGYNAVRVFLNYWSARGIGDAATGGLSGGYLDNLADALARATASGMVVMLTLDWLPAGIYGEILGRDCCTTFGFNNVHILSPGGVEANRRFFGDLVRGLKAHGAPLDAIWSYELRNEQSFDSDRPPLSFASGEVRTANGRTYDMSSPSDRQRMMDEGLVYWIGRVRAAIRSVDPTALVSIGFFVPQGPNPARPGDARVIETREVMRASAADFYDLHFYPGLDLTLSQAVENYGVRGVVARPVVMGEFGAFRTPYPTVQDAATALVSVQAESCGFGFDGWLTWTWDSGEQAELYDALSGDDRIEQTLSPAVRPNPCSEGAAGAVNLALGRPATATSSLPDHAPGLAVDGSSAAGWSAGAGPTQSIEIDLGAPATVTSIRLLVDQFPAGFTRHRVFGRASGGAESLLAELAGDTAAGQWLERSPPHGWSGVRYVRVETVESPSWVAWREIQVFGAFGP